MSSPPPPPSRKRTHTGELKEETTEELINFALERRRALEASLAGKSGEDIVVEGRLEGQKMFGGALEQMLYGFGDVSDPLEETVQAVEDIVIDYVRSMTLAAMQVAAKRGKIKTEDLFFLVRADGKKFERAREILRMHEKIKAAREELDEAASLSSARVVKKSKRSKSKR